ncbi:hypothetical protein AB6A23_19345 [Paenibacillus tarimensis]
MKAHFGILNTLILSATLIVCTVMVTNSLKQLHYSSSVNASLTGGISLQGFERELDNLSRAQKFAAKEALTPNEVVEYLGLDDQRDFEMNLIMGEIELPHVIIDGQFLYSKTLLDEWIVSKV